MLGKWLPLDGAEVKLITPESNDTVIDKEKAAFPNVEIHSWLSSYCELLFSSVETCGGTKTCGIALFNYEAIDERYRWKISLPLYPLSGEKVWQMVNHCKYFFFVRFYFVSFGVFISLFLLSFLFHTRWGSELDGWSVLWFGFILCCCWEENWRPPSLCAIFSGLQVPGTWQSLQVSVQLPLANSQMSYQSIVAVNIILCCAALLQNVCQVPNYIKVWMGVHGL